ncbi:MAG: hypothetical protein GWM98_00935, partial [Nitrospinaceae bacterium]|nr:hypothetical protein [Nitrospinaceae bacterium]NIR53332.1 hypothetical protein [Nitrospinaceae bacterium]NIS83734.1 hypothetical protein [Nitrospinaceae bacterium]NIT80531.1 hypothetical protein [Nitrospinaceae bacterium]NIU42858.1 hypothetical protein [Nitrospinaceae bacterium]
GRTLVVRIQKAGPDVLEKILARAAEQVKRPEEEFPRVRSRSRPASGLAEDSREKENPPRNFTSVALAQTPDPPPPRSSPSPKPSSGPAEKKSTFAKSKPKTLSAGEPLNLLPSGLKMLGM